MTDPQSNRAQDIQNVINRYTNDVNRRDWTRLPQLFAEEAVWEAPGLPGARFESRDAIVAGIPALVANGSDLLVQMNTPADIRIEGDRARAECTIRETGTIEKDQIRFEAHGIYDDTLVLRDGAWRFTHRCFVILEVRHEPLQGRRLF